MIVNGYGPHRSLAAHREQIEAAIARHRDKLAREHIEATRAAERYEFERRQTIAAEQRMRAAQDPSLISWYGAVVTLFLMALIGGVLLIANYLGN